MQWRRAFTIKELLLAVVILLVALAILLPMSLRSATKRSLAEDVRRMREVYVGLSVYESEVDAQLPPDLVQVRPYIKSDAVLLSTGDPYWSLASGSFPIDPGIPESSKPTGSPVRISFSYLYAFAEFGKARAKPWPQAKFDGRLGLIADEWQGSVEAVVPFNARVSGPLYRVNADGSVIRIDRSTVKRLGDAQDLFFRAPPTAGVTH